MKFAEVIVDITTKHLNRPFTYIIPEHLKEVLFIGMEIIIPFGKGNTPRKGYLINISDKCDYPIDKLKTILDVNEKSVQVESRLIDIAYYMSIRYGAPLINCLKMVLPVKSKVKNRTTRSEEFFENSKDIALNKEQQDVYDKIVNNIEKGTNKNYLLKGVTGSGKTLVYIKLMEKILSQGKTGIVLIPEISLTPQTISRFKSYFGDRVGVIHSRLSSGEKYEIFEKVKQKEIDVVIGPRSALFMPLENIGLIVMDEEHESSYKSEKSPCYHCRDIAMYIAKKEGATFLMGSATPSISAYYLVKNDSKNFELLTLKNRANGSALPKINIVDMREELKSGNKSIISNALDEAITQALDEGEQIILFLNRRGYSGFVSCRSCGYTVTCDHCDVSMSYHNDGKMKCHYCGATKPRPNVCPECGSKHISEMRIGTQQLEEIIKKKYENARVIRMDADTTKNKNGHEKILKVFKEKKADILIGTQMIVKGHDFPDVTVVGAIMADMSLNAGDFMSSERTFDLLVQASGRAGRGEKQGAVFIQTYNPDNYAIEFAGKQDYLSFYNKEIQYRKLMGYPPASNFLKILMQSKDEGNLEVAIKHFFAQVKKFEKHGVFVIGPTEPYIRKLNDIYRKVIYVKAKDYDILIKLRKYMEEYFKINKGFKNMTLLFDFNPMGD